MRIRALASPVEVIDNDRIWTVSGLEASVLTVLALRAPHVVSQEILYSSVWNGHTPEIKRVQDVVFNIRRQIPPIRQRLVTKPGGYSLTFPIEDVDVHFVRRHVELARTALEHGEDDVALRLSTLALGCFEGPPLVALKNTPLDFEVDQFDDLALTARTINITARLNKGENASTAIELERLVREWPLREQFWELLLTCYYRDGRPDDALRAFERAKDGLRDQLGIEPGPGLQDLYDAVLIHDDGVFGPPPSRVVTLVDRAESSNDEAEFEIAMYWGYRPAAHEDLRRTLYEATGSIEVVGIGLTTIADVLNDPRVLTRLATQFRDEPEFYFASITSAEPSERRRQEEGGSLIMEKLRTGRDSLRKFYDQIVAQVPEARDRVHFLSYGEKVEPRHFMLSTGPWLYAGSYLSHQQGRYSYLMKLRDQGDGLYGLFRAEIQYLMQTAVPHPDLP